MCIRDFILGTLEKFLFFFPPLQRTSADSTEADMVDRQGRKVLSDWNFLFL